MRSSITARKAVTHSSIRRTQARLKNVILRRTRRQGEEPGATPALALLYRNTPDQEPIREHDQAEDKQSREPVQHAQLRLLVRHSRPGTASASVTTPCFVVHDSPAFAALFRHQPDYARCQFCDLLPQNGKSPGTPDAFGLSHEAGTRRTLAASSERCLTRTRQRFKALGDASAMTSPNSIYPIPDDMTAAMRTRMTLLGSRKMD